MIRQRGKTGKYHYQFVKDKKLYSGVCEGCATKREAEAYEKRIRETVIKAAGQKPVKAIVEVFRDELSGGHPVSLAEAFDAYLMKPTRRKPGEHQIVRNRTYWRDFVAFMGTRHPDITTLANVQKRHAEEYIMLLRNSGAFLKEVVYQQGKKELRYTPKNDQLSARTINARHKAIKAVFSRLADDAGLAGNPFNIPTLEGTTTHRDAFSDEELKRIGEAMTMPYTRPLFTIGLCTGLTTGDICLLKWREISGNWIANKRREKTGTSLEIPILPPLAAFLDEQRERTGDGEYVCPELAEMYTTNPSGVFYRVKKFLGSIGIATSSKVDGRSRSVSTKAAHAMRHTFAYLAGVYNIPQPIVQGVLGHMTPEMTALYQCHARREQKEKFFRQMPNVLGVSTSRALPPTAMIEEDAERAALLHEIEAMPPEEMKAMLHQHRSAQDKNDRPQHDPPIVIEPAPKDLKPKKDRPERDPVVLDEVQKFVEWVAQPSKKLSYYAKHATPEDEANFEKVKTELLAKASSIKPHLQPISDQLDALGLFVVSLSTAIHQPDSPTENQIKFWALAETFREYMKTEKNSDRRVSRQLILDMIVSFCQLTVDGMDIAAGIKSELQEALRTINSKKMLLQKARDEIASKDEKINALEIVALETLREKHPRRPALTHKAAAGACGVTPKTIGRWEKYRRGEPDGTKPPEWYPGLNVTIAEMLARARDEMKQKKLARAVQQSVKNARPLIENADSGEDRSDDDDE